MEEAGLVDRGTSEPLDEKIEEAVREACDGRITDLEEARDLARKVRDIERERCAALAVRAYNPELAAAIRGKQ